MAGNLGSRYEYKIINVLLITEIPAIKNKGFK